MTQPNETFNYILYTRRLTSPAGLAELVRVVEDLFPPHRLFATLNDSAKPVPLDAPAEWAFAEAEKDDFQMVILCNANEDEYVSLMLGHQRMGGEVLSQVMIQLPPTLPRSRFFPLVAGGGNAVDALWGNLSNAVTWGRIAEQRAPRGQPQYGLPKLDWNLSTPEIPIELGWISYFGPAAVGGFGLGDPGDLVPPYCRAERTPLGSVVAQLTEDSLDLEKADHVAALKAAYVRLPRVGHG